MTKCNMCGLIESKTGMIYEDNIVYAYLNPKPAMLGHIVVVPKKHYPIIEQIPDKEVADIFKIVNTLSKAAFEALGMQGTNIIVQNGIAAGQKSSHFSVNIIPRRENDGLSFEWKPKRLDEEEMSTVELQLKDETNKIGQYEEPVVEDTVDNPNLAEEPRKTPKKPSSNKMNYLIKQLERIP